jgi:hypothetical protein
MIGSEPTATGYACEAIPNKPIVAGKTKDSENENMEAPDASLTAPLPYLPRWARWPWERPHSPSGGGREDAR